MIQAVDLTKQFGKLAAVDRLNLHIKAGEFFCFLGPNGAGKTTTIKMLTGLVRPTSGQAILGGHDIQANPVAAKKMISFVPDSAYLYDKLSPVEFISFVGQLRSEEHTSELQSRFGI